MAIYTDAGRVQQTLGPSISSAIDFMDGSQGGERFVIEDDGFPNLMLNALRACLDAPGGGRTRAIAARADRGARARAIEPRAT